MQLAACRWWAWLLIALPPAVLTAADESDDTPAVPEAVVEAEADKPLAIGSWLNTPPDRQAVAFDVHFNRLYFNAEGQVVGRYNRRAKKFEAGEFRPAQWHNISPKPAAAKDDAWKSPSDRTGGGDAATTTRSPIVPRPRDPPVPKPEPPKPAEIYRRGQAATGGGSRAGVKVIETSKPLP